jgi:hypothetical protein
MLAVAPVKSRLPPAGRRCRAASRPGSMRRAASRPNRKPPKQQRRQVSSKNSSLISSSGLMRLLPAL